jgi:hypothetical protein
MGAKETLPAIAEFMKGGEWVARESAAEAMDMLASKEALPVIIGLLKDGDHVREKAAWLLGRMGAEETSVAPLLADPNSHVRIAAADALCRIGSTKGVAVALRSGSYFGLNRLREPKVWERLQETVLKEDFHGTDREVLERLATQCGLALEYREPVFRGKSPPLGVRYSVPKRSCVLKALEGMLMGRHVVLEPDRIRLLEEAGLFLFWARWWAGRD